FLALAAEHRSTDHLNPAQIGSHCIHSPIPLEYSCDQPAITLFNARRSTANSRNWLMELNTSVAQPSTHPLICSLGMPHTRKTGSQIQYSNFSPPCVPAPRPACSSQ